MFNFPYVSLFPQLVAGPIVRYVDVDKELKEPSFNHDNSDETVCFLSKDILKHNDFEQELFKHSIGKTIIMFEGFDLISPYYNELVIDLIQALRKSKTKQLWITTRPSMRAELEDKLQQFAHILEPFSKDNQIDFLVKEVYRISMLNLVVR